MSFRTITVKKALEHISRNDYVLPAIQREFVWSPDQIGRLFDSLLRNYPIGTFLFWQVPPELTRSFRFYDFMREYHELKSRHSSPVPIAETRTITAVLDGQQRLTALNLGLLGYLATRKKFGRANNPAAYPKRFLHLDLEHRPSDDDEVSYRFAFLTESDAARPGTGSTWFRIGDVLDLEEGAGIFRWVQRNRLAEHPTAFETLDRLWRAVHAREVVSYFEDDSDSIDRVLEIFIRTNSGGTVLSKSDLLLSVATAQFVQLDARAAVHGLVDDLNTVGQGFAFTKDNVLKAGLMLTDRPAIQFRVDAFTAENVSVLEARWDEIDQALRIAAQLLASFGFSERTLSAASVVLPVADYVAHRRLGPDYVTSPAHRADREQMRRWVIRSLLKQGIWGSGLDTLLTRLRRAIRSSGASGFPADELEREMLQLGKSLTLSREEIEELVETPITNRRAFPLLALLYPGVDTRNEFHVDHIFPRSLFAGRKLAEAGVAEDRRDEYQDLRDRLPNLQLLEGPVNVSKQASLPAEWIRTHQPDPTARAGWLAAHDMAYLPETMEDFLLFYDKRRDLMFERLQRLLEGTGDAASGSPASPPTWAASNRPASPPLEWATSHPPASPPTAEIAPTPAAPVARGEGLSDSHWAPSGPRPSSPHDGRRQNNGSSRRTHARSLSELPPGRLVYRHRGVEHWATVEGAAMQLDTGEVFSNPSRAALAVNGGVSVNGWRAWTMDGVAIGDVVDRLRDQR